MSGFPQPPALASVDFAVPTLAVADPALVGGSNKAVQSDATISLTTIKNALSGTYAPLSGAAFTGAVSITPSTNVLALSVVGGAHSSDLANLTGSGQAKVRIDAGGGIETNGFISVQGGVANPNLIPRGNSSYMIGAASDITNGPIYLSDLNATSVNHFEAWEGTDTNPKFGIAPHGDLRWGPGTGAFGPTFDTFLHRAGVNFLKTDGAFEVGAGLAVDGSFVGVGGGGAQGWYIGQASVYSGATNTGAVLSFGTGAPVNANGSNGDIYLRVDGAALSTMYQRRVGVWVGIL